jgi:putative oxidoreductase
MISTMLQSWCSVAAHRHNATRQWGNQKMENENLTRNLKNATLVLRITLAIFLFQWGIEKFIVPSNTPLIWGYFYGITIPEWTAYVFGAVEIVLAVCYVLGLLPAITYVLGAALHAITVVVSWKALINPWGDPVSHLFVASIPVLGAFIALYLLRSWDSPLLTRDVRS